MKLGVRYETAYRYAAPVRFSRHELRLIPRGDVFTQLLRWKFETNEGATVRIGRDVFDNCVVACSFAEPATELRFQLELDLVLEKKNPFDFILAPEAATLPFSYSPGLRRALAPYQKTRGGQALEIPRWERPTIDHTRPTVATLVELNERLHECIGYERREEGPARAPAKTLEIGKGACRDVALLLAAILRQIGLAVRLTSGYLREADAKSHRAEGSLHAWAEVYLPGAGWVGMDPTNGIFCNHNFITAAVGIEPADVTPIDGSYYQRGPTATRMTSRIELVNL
ncbi:MAG TPA: transglutaminase family protein [Chthoniobacterales bacterium]